MYNYYGWKVSDSDPGPANWKKQGKDLTTEGNEELLRVINTDVLSNKRTALEIGVNYGFGIPLLSKHFNHVHTFDFPNDIFECFQANMQERNINNLTIHSYGLGAENMQVANIDRFRRKGFNRGALANSVVDDQTQLREGEDQYISQKKFEVKTLDSLHIEDVDLVIIDTEGYEVNVLQGATETIKRYSPVLVVEFSAKQLSKYNYTIQKLEKFLIELGYQHHNNLNAVDRVYVCKV